MPTDQTQAEIEDSVAQSATELTERDDNLDELGDTLDANGTPAMAADEDETGEIAYGEPGNQYREPGNEQANFYAGGTAPDSVDYYPAGNPTAGVGQEGWAKETGGVRPHHEDAILSENGMHITDTP